MGQRNQEKQLELFSKEETLSQDTVEYFGVKYAKTDPSILDKERDEAFAKIKSAFGHNKDYVASIEKTFLECSKKTN